jgi:hypothetical protein
VVGGYNDYAGCELTSVDQRIAELTSGGMDAEADGEFLADLAVDEGDDVVGVAVDADQAGDLHVDAGLLLDLADDGLGDGFADLLGSAGDA